MMARLLRALARIEDRLFIDWVADLVGVVSIIASGYGLLLIGHGLGLK